MAKEKLSYEQNIALKDLNLQEKLNLLHEWKKSGEISKAAFQCFSDLWIKKESTKAFSKKDALRRYSDENSKRNAPKSVVESEIKSFTEMLRGKINDFVTYRRKDTCQITSEEWNKFLNYVRNYSYYNSLINRLIVVGLRYPDKELNKFCCDYVKEHRQNDILFWVLLWEDSNLVPMDAVRLMLLKKDDGFAIKSKYFSLRLIRDLIPLIELQRDKEIERLRWAQMLDGTEHEVQVARKSQRLNAFNILLEAAKKYCE